MNLIKNLFAVAAVASTVAFVGCGKDAVEEACNVTCAETEVVTADCKCVTVATPVNEVTSNITADATWSGEVVLKSRIAVTNGATLTIEPGTIVKGGAGSGTNATALIIAKGAKINAAGTADKPIIFTSVADEIEPGQTVSPNMDPALDGLWGGLIVLGDAPISAKTGAAAQIEGIPANDSNGNYGGDNVADDSGVITYVSIRHGGANIGEGNEINGLTLGGVGTGTKIENIEVVANQDDGIEIFGGTVNVSNILLWNCGDDSIDTDQAWNGTLKNFIIVTPTKGSAMELDGPESDFAQGDNTIENGIIYAGDKIDHIIDWDDNTNSIVKDVYVFGLDADYSGKGIESFGGSTTGSGNYEYTLPEGKTVEDYFAGVPADQLKAVAAGSYSVGPMASDFAWTAAADAIKELGIK